MPVTIRHVMEGPDPWLAFFGTVALALAAVVIALITLSRVNRQIVIANRQLSIAAEELAAVKADFDLAQKQFEEFGRAPNSPSAFLSKSPWSTIFRSPQRNLLG